MKGIILAGGTGSRLYPLTVCTNKQLLPVYDKPMIYYPLSTLLQAGIKDICIVSTASYNDLYRKLLGDGSRIGINITYKVQEAPLGIAHAILISEEFIKNEEFCLILGDNIFHGIDKSLFPKTMQNGAQIYGYKVKNPKSYGVVEFENDRVVSIEEKPSLPKSNYAIPGIYFYDSNAIDYVKKLTPSSRGELEITDLNKKYLCNDSLRISILNGIAWLDAGTPDSLYDAASYIKSIQDRQGIKIGCIEESALQSGFITKEKLKTDLSGIPESDYKEYLKTLCI